MKKPYVIKSRGWFKCDAVEPFKVSRSQIEAFVECPRCFWLNHRRGMRRPSSPPFLINTLVDRVLRKEFDVHRAAQTSHPIMIAHGLDAVPFQHPQIDEWRENFVGMQFHDEHTNLNIAGAGARHAHSDRSNATQNNASQRNAIEGRRRVALAAFGLASGEEGREEVLRIAMLLLIAVFSVATCFLSAVLSGRFASPSPAAPP
jgi:hypothetical protein